MHRLASRLALVLLAGLLAVPARLDPEPAVDARKGNDKGKGNGGTKVVTRTFANAGAIVTPSTGKATPYPATIAVAGLKKGKLRDVDLVLRNVNHALPGELDIMLASPDGRTAVVMSDVGSGFSLANVTLTLDDEAPIPMPAAAQMISQAYQPENVDQGPIDTFPDAPLQSGAVSLSTFDGIDPNGVWQLFVVDSRTQTAGSIAGGWELRITAKVEAKKGKGNGKGGGNGRNDGQEKGKGKGKGKANKHANR